MNRFYQLLGGRKQANGYLAALLLTVFAFLLPEATYALYGKYLLIALGLAVGGVTFEDSVRGWRNRLEARRAVSGSAKATLDED